MASAQDTSAEYDYDSESDYDDDGEEAAGGSKDNKDHHNNLERKRRNEYGVNVKKLTQLIPELRNQKMSRRAKIQKTAEVIEKQVAWCLEHEPIYEKELRETLSMLMGEKWNYYHGWHSEEQYVEICCMAHPEFSDYMSQFEDKDYYMKMRSAQAVRADTETFEAVYQQWKPKDDDEESETLVHDLSNASSNDSMSAGEDESEDEEEL